jgi:hypothetical protein
MMKIEGYGSASGSISPRHGSADPDPDPHQKCHPQHWFLLIFRLILNPDNTFEVSIDHTLVNHGTLLDSFEPPVNPPAEIDDPNDKMPAGMS